MEAKGSLRRQDERRQRRATNANILEHRQHGEVYIVDGDYCSTTTVPCVTKGRQQVRTNCVKSTECSQQEEFGHAVIVSRPWTFQHLLPQILFTAQSLFRSLF